MKNTNTFQDFVHKYNVDDNIKNIMLDILSFDNVLFDHEAVIFNNSLKRPLKFKSQNEAIINLYCLIKESYRNDLFIELYKLKHPLSIYFLYGNKNDQFKFIIKNKKFITDFIDYISNDVVFNLDIFCCTYSSSSFYRFSIMLYDQLVLKFNKKKYIYSKFNFIKNFLHLNIDDINKDYFNMIFTEGNTIRYCNDDAMKLLSFGKKNNSKFYKLVSNNKKLIERLSVKVKLSDEDLTFISILKFMFDYNKYAAELYLEIIIDIEVEKFYLFELMNYIEANYDEEYNDLSLKIANILIIVPEYQLISLDIIKRESLKENKDSYLNYGLYLIHETDFKINGIEYLLRGLQHNSKDIDGETRANLFKLIADTYVSDDEVLHKDEIIKFYYMSYKLGNFNSSYNLIESYIKYGIIDKAEYFSNKIVNEINMLLKDKSKNDTYIIELEKIRILLLENIKFIESIRNKKDNLTIKKNKNTNNVIKFVPKIIDIERK